MKGLSHFVNLLNENWTIIIAVATLLLALYLKIKASIDKWVELSEEEKQAEIDEQIKKAKQAIANYILSLVAAAEVDWDGSGLGEIKRAQVIEKIYENFPILLEVVDQRELMKFIDEHIDMALETVRKKLRKEVEE
jgi:hypothetical protein